MDEGWARWVRGRVLSDAWRVALDVLMAGGEHPPGTAFIIRRAPSPECPEGPFFWGRETCWVDSVEEARIYQAKHRAKVAALRAACSNTRRAYGRMLSDIEILTCIVIPVGSEVEVSGNPPKS